MSRVQEEKAKSYIKENFDFDINTFDLLMSPTEREKLNLQRVSSPVAQYIKGSSGPKVECSPRVANFESPRLMQQSLAKPKIPIKPLKLAKSKSEI